MCINFYFQITHFFCTFKKNYKKITNNTVTKIITIWIFISNKQAIKIPEFPTPGQHFQKKCENCINFACHSHIKRFTYKSDTLGKIKIGKDLLQSNKKSIRLINIIKK